MGRIYLLSFIAATAVRQLPFDQGTDSEAGEVTFTLLPLSCAVDGATAWEHSGEDRQIMSELKVYNASEAMLFLGSNVVNIDGDLKGTGDRSWELTVTYFDEMGPVPEGDEETKDVAGLFEGARKWEEGAKLAIVFDADWKGCTISGNGVVIAFQLVGNDEEAAFDGHFVGGILAGCTVDQQKVWPSSASNDSLVAAWVRRGDEAVFFVESCFRVRGTYTETSETSGLFSVTYFEEEDIIPDGAEQMLSGAKRWAKGAQLRIKVTDTAVVVRGRRVKFHIERNEMNDYLNAYFIEAALRTTYAVQVMFSRLSGENPVIPETLIKLGKETLFSTADGGNRATLLKLEEGNRVHVVRKLSNGRKVRCKFKVVKPEGQNGERTKACTMGKVFAIFRSIPMEKYVGNEKEYAAWMDKYA